MVPTLNHLLSSYSLFHRISVPLSLLLPSRLLLHFPLLFHLPSLIFIFFLAFPLLFLSLFLFLRIPILFGSGVYLFICVSLHLSLVCLSLYLPHTLSLLLPSYLSSAPTYMYCTVSTLPSEVNTRSRINGCAFQCRLSANLKEHSRSPLGLSVSLFGSLSVCPSLLLCLHSPLNLHDRVSHMSQILHESIDTDLCFWSISHNSDIYDMCCSSMSVI